MDNVKIALVGCGHWGSNIARALNRTGNLFAIVDNDYNSAAKISNSTGVPALSLEEVLQNKTVDGVVIATPAETHKELSLKAIQHGKHIFVEKPLALSLNDGIQIVEKAEEKNVIHMVGHLLRYHPAFETLEREVSSDDFGKILYISASRLSFGRFRFNENALWSLAPHDISMVLALTNQYPSSISSCGREYLDSGVKDSYKVDMQFKSGIHAHISSNWLSPFKEQKLVVVGRHKMIVFDDTLPWEKKLKIFSIKWDASLKFSIPAKSQGEYLRLIPEEPLQRECNHFISCIKSLSPPLTSGKEALAVMRVLQEAS